MQIACCKNSPALNCDPCDNTAAVVSIVSLWFLKSGDLKMRNKTDMFYNLIALGMLNDIFANAKINFPKIM